jgi:hypothetical protein
MPSKRSDAELDDAAARHERPLKVRARAADILTTPASPAISSESFDLN